MRELNDENTLAKIEAAAARKELENRLVGLQSIYEEQVKKSVKLRIFLYYKLERSE